MREIMMEKAQELGRLLGQTDEYQALERARQRVADDRDLADLLNRLGDLESDIALALRQGETPSADTREVYEATASELQAKPAYQALVSAQSNLDKVLTRVNEEIGEGMSAGAQSRIILPS